MNRTSRRTVLGFTCLLITLLSTGLVGTGLAIAVDTPTEPPPCGNTGLPCEPIPLTPGTPVPGTPAPGENLQTPNSGVTRPNDPGSTNPSSPGGGSTTGGSGGGGGGNNNGGKAPVIAIGASELIVGSPVAVSIAFIDGGYNEAGAGMVVRVTVSVEFGTVSIGGGPAGPSATITAPYSSIINGITDVLVTANRAGETTISVTATPADDATGGISGSRALVAAEPVQTPTAIPTPEVTQAPAEQALAPVTNVVAANDPRAAISQPRSITLPTYDPLEQPKQVVDTTIAVIAVLGVVGLSAGVMAGGVPAPSPSGSGSGSGSPDAQNKRAEDVGRHQGGHVRAARTEGSLASVDASFTGLAAVVGSAGLTDRWHIWRPPLTTHVDRSHHVTIASASRLSPLTARLLADNTYLRAIFGSGALLLPIAAVVLAVLGVIGVNGLALAPSVMILGLITFIGALDAMAGFAAFAVFTAGVAVSGGITGADSIRTLLGLGVIGFGPALIAGATRPLRRGRDDYDLWERLTDFVIIPLIGAFAVQSMVGALAGLSGYQLPIVSSANLIALIALIGLLMRVSLEEFAARAFPERLAAVSPAVNPTPGVLHRSIVAALRTGVFIFVAIAFIGTSWQLWAGAAIFAAAQACEIIAKYLPNNPRLFHAVPVGVPKLVLILLISLGISTAISLLITDGRDLARTSFVILMIPGLALAALGMFGKEPREGDTRWYLRDSMRVWYRIGGGTLLVTAVYLTQFN